MLDSFTIQDQFDLDIKTIREYSLDSAHRRAEMMGWSNVRIKLCFPCWVQNEYVCYKVEILGDEASDI